MEKYRAYFDIDPDYFPAVNPDVIKSNPELWKKFYPHETFIKLIKDTVSVLNRIQKLNIWVEGAYGTGKSHAVLTLKRLLDSTPEETIQYFNDFNLDNILLTRFLQAKSQGKIITVHRYASSSIKGDNDLFIAIQESIELALKRAGIENAGTSAMKDAIIKYLSDGTNKATFSIYVEGPYKTLFGGESVDDIICHLQEYTEDALREMMRKISKVANERQIKAFTLDSLGLCNWIREVIQKNNLNALVFIWDEFTEYFQNNITELTGFQELLELSQSEPFCFIPVTHKSDALFNDADKMKSKILGRFIKPRCIIELPENMAFQLMGAAMKKKSDPLVEVEWNNDIMEELRQRTRESRALVKKATSLNDKEMEGILPIHPYAASLLKHISTSFDSNQRSMFDFIKNNKGDDAEAFQWFIDNCGPYDANPFLTIDMLWNFFYDQGKDSLATSIRQILDNFPRLKRTHSLNDSETRILKAVLLFQAISFEVRDEVELFFANEKNLNSAFEGSDLDTGEASRIAEKLVKDQILFKKNVGKGFVYAVLIGEMDANQIGKYKAQFENKTTPTLIQEGSLNEAIELPAALKLRYKLSYAGLSDFETIAKKAINEANNNQKKIYGVVTFAKDMDERILLKQKIKTKLQEFPDSDIVYIDCGKTILGKDKFADWVEHKATAYFFSGKDRDQANQNTDYASGVLNEWKENIQKGAFVYYSKTRPSGESLASIDVLIEELQNYNKLRFPYGIECYNVIDNMWNLNAAKQGAECGIKQEIAGTFRSANPATKLENALKEVWQEEEYWKKSPSLNISIIKTSVEEIIRKKMKNDGRISIKDIYNHLKEVPYGFMPCNLTAFVLGFLLKEYYGGKYSWSDGTTSDELTLDKMKEMIDEVLKLENTPNIRYKDKYIVTMTPEEKSFIDTTSASFGISKSRCSSIEATRERVRGKMKELSFPIWPLTYIIEEQNLSTDKDVIKELIKLYGYLANNVKEETGMSENDIAIKIGKICLANVNAVDDLKILFTADKCTEGIKTYLDIYKDGELPTLAKEVSDGNQYVNVLRSKFDADAANWVWRQNTAEKVIDDVILEYQIIVESNKLVDTSKSYGEVLKVWSNKVGNIRLAYNSIKNDVGELDKLLDNLYQIRQMNKLQEQVKQQFLENLKILGGDFVDFYNNRQFDTFKKVCDFELTGLNDADKEKLFRMMPMGCFTKDKTEYVNMVSQQVEELKKDLCSMKLKNLWLKKTGTQNPYQWSQQYKMPIFTMLTDVEYSECRSMFSIINHKNPDNKDIAKAITYLENATFFDSLNDASLRDKMFIKKVIGDNAVMLKDIDEVKNYLINHVTDAPYYWYGSPAVRICLEKMAEAKYNKDGYEIAFHKIDSMTADDVKRYLKELIKNNKNVGVEIIKNN